MMNNALPPQYDMNMQSNQSSLLRKITIFLVLIVFILSVFILIKMPFALTEPKVETFTRESIISKIQSLNRLQTVAYNVDTVIQSYKEGNWYALWQDEQKGLFLAQGRVLAGVDLNQLKTEHVRLLNDGQTIEITLPSAQIFETYLDKIDVYDIKTGMFGIMNLDPELFTLAQEEGKKQVLQRACQAQILNLATENAQKQVKTLFELANVSVTIKTTAIKSCTMT